MRILTFLFLLTALGATHPVLEDRWISVSGITLHIRCGGERRSKAPMVLLEAGAGTSTDTWSYVHTPIAEFARAFADALREKPWRGTVPVVVLTRSRQEATNGDPNAEARYALWIELQRDLANRSPKSEHIVAKNSGHVIQVDEPQLVIDAVRRVL